jgi:hypothetical protein
MLTIAQREQLGGHETGNEMRVNICTKLVDVGRDRRSELRRECAARNLWVTKLGKRASDVGHEAKRRRR